MPQVPPSNDQTTWESDILTGIGAPVTSNNTGKLNAWNRCEGNKSGGSGLPINNPFNTTLSINAGTSVNGAGVKQYPSWAAGLQATVQTLQGGAYKSIVSNLTSDGPFDQFASAVGSSPWGTSGSCIASVGGGTSSASQPGGGSGGAAGSGSSSSGGSSSASACVINVPVVGCMLTKSNVKALKGGLLIAGGGILLLSGTLVLVAFGLQRSGAARVASRTLSTTGLGKVAKVSLRGTRASTATAKQTVRSTGSTGRAATQRPSARLRPLPDEVGLQAEESRDEGDELFDMTRGSGRQNRAGYKRAMGAARDTSDLTRKTA